MSNIPEPQKTPDGPVHEGRLPNSADQDVMDQDVAFDLGTLLSRRSAPSTGAAPSSAVTLTEIPDETVGPYPGDEFNDADALAESGIVRSNIRTSIGE